MNTKKIIAKQGLIILGILATTSVLIWLSSMMVIDGTHLTRVEIGKHIFEIQTEKYPLPYSYEDQQKILNDLRNEKLLDENDAVFLYPLENKMKLVYEGRSAKSFWQKIVNKTKEPLFNIGLLGLFFAYPVYLIFCFVIWAIKTLNKKDSS